MASQRGLGVYRELLGMPYAAWLTFTGVTAQYSGPLVGLGLIFAVQQAYDSFVLAGSASAAQSVTFAILGPTVGRIIDRYGQRAVALPLTFLWTACMVHLMAALYFRAPEWVIVVGAIGAGLPLPFGPMLRARWNVLVGQDHARLNSAYSMSRTFEELIWATGTPMATVLGIWFAPFGGLLAGTIATAVLGTLFLLCPHHEPPSLVNRRRRWRSQLTGPSPVTSTVLDEATAPTSHDAAQPSNGPTAPGTPRTRVDDRPAPAAPASPIFTRGMVALLAILVGYGMQQPTMILGIVATAETLGQQEWSGLVIACFSTGAMCGAIVYGARIWATPLWKRFLFCLSVVLLGCSTLILMGTLPALGVVLLFSGAFHSPTLENINHLIVRLLPATRFTEGATLTITMMLVGNSVSKIVTGAIVDRWEASGAFTMTIVFGMFTLATAVILMGTIRRGMIYGVTPAHADTTTRDELSDKAAPTRGG